jgi:hypothetical protein
MHGLLRLMCLDVVRITYISLYVSQFTERLPAGAGRISDVLFQVLKYDVFCDGAVGG